MTTILPCFSGALNMDTAITDPSSLPGSDTAKTAFWQQHVDAWRASKLTQRGYATEHSLGVARFVYWKNKLYPNPRDKKKQFVAVRVATSQQQIRLTHPDGFVVECTTGTDVTWLRALMGLNNAS